MIIDWESKGHLIRLYFGYDSLKHWTGDDWDDIPWETNAGVVYEEYIHYWTDIAISFDWDFKEPDSKWSKSDMVKRKTPILTIYKNEQSLELYMGDNFNRLYEVKRCLKILGTGITGYRTVED
jgi:hypothetical protein